MANSRIASTRSKTSFRKSGVACTDGSGKQTCSKSSWIAVTRTTFPNQGNIRSQLRVEGFGFRNPKNPITAYNLNPKP